MSISPSVPTPIALTLTPETHQSRQAYEDNILLQVKEKEEADPHFLNGVVQNRLISLRRDPVAPALVERVFISVLTQAASYDHDQNQTQHQAHTSLPSLLHFLHQALRGQGDMASDADVSGRGNPHLPAYGLRILRLDDLGNPSSEMILLFLATLLVLLFRPSTTPHTEHTSQLEFGDKKDHGRGNADQIEREDEIGHMLSFPKNEPASKGREEAAVHKGDEGMEEPQLLASLSLHQTDEVVLRGIWFASVYLLLGLPPHDQSVADTESESRSRALVDAALNQGCTKQSSSMGEDVVLAQETTAMTPWSPDERDAHKSHNSPTQRYSEDVNGDKRQERIASFLERVTRELVVRHLQGRATKSRDEGGIHADGDEDKWLDRALRVCKMLKLGERRLSVIWTLMRDLTLSQSSHLPQALHLDRDQPETYTGRTSRRKRALRERETGETGGVMQFQGEREREPDDGTHSRVITGSGCLEKRKYERIVLSTSPTPESSSRQPASLVPSS